MFINRYNLSVAVDDVEDDFGDLAHSKTSFLIRLCCFSLPNNKTLVEVDILALEDKESGTASGAKADTERFVFRSFFFFFLLLFLLDCFLFLFFILSSWKKQQP